MAELGAFIAGAFARLGLFLAIPLAFVLALGAAVLARRVFLVGRAEGDDEEPKGAASARPPPPQPQKAGWLAFDPAAAYAPGHVWLREAGERLRVGLDDLALRLLPEIAEVRLPETGFSLAAGETLAVVRVAGHEVPIPAPVGGRVAARNPAARDRAALAGEAEGWLVELVSDGHAFQPLKKGEAARAWLAEEGSRLVACAERDLGLAAADGGEVALPSVGSLPEEKWREFIKGFLGVEARKAVDRPR